METVKVTNRGCVAPERVPVRVLMAGGCDLRDCCGDRLSDFEVKVGNTDSWSANTKVLIVSLFVMH